MTETSCVTVISEQGGKETQHGNDKRFGPACDTSMGDLESVLGDITGGSATRRPNPEVVARAQRKFTAEYKQGILAQIDAANGSGGIGALLRREGLYSSHLTKWRREREDGILEDLTPRKRGNWWRPCHGVSCIPDQPRADGLHHCSCRRNGESPGPL